jgi:hypothetical protein
MGFRTKEYKKARFSPRIETLPLPDLADWFDDGPPEWTVKGLNGNELAHCKEMAARNRKTITAILETLTTEDAVAALKCMTGTDGAVPMDIALRMELLVAGSVEPICDIELAARLNMAHPAEFQMLTKKIMRLTGLGYAPGK